jgi:uroporphyrinogen-III decarboxylase
MDIVELLWGSDLFLDVVDRPELVHALLQLVTDTYIRFMQAWEAIVPPANGHAVHWGAMHAGRIMLRDDSAMNFSPGMFDEFIRPYDQELLQTCGEGAVHFCGRGDHYIESCCRMQGMHAIAMSQPHLNDMETIYRNTVDKGIKLIHLRMSAAQAALENGRDLHGCVQSN